LSEVDAMVGAFSGPYVDERNRDRRSSVRCNDDWRLPGDIRKRSSSRGFAFAPIRHRQCTSQYGRIPFGIDPAGRASVILWIIITPEPSGNLSSNEKIRAIYDDVEKPTRRGDDLDQGTTTLFSAAHRSKDSNCCAPIRSPTLQGNVAQGGM